MLLSYDDVGAGPAVMLLHAGVGDRRMWAVQATPLSARRRVICPDLRGFGDSPLPAGSYSSVDDLVTLWDHLGIAEAAVVGASMGGRVALELATRHPDRVRALGLVGAAFRGLEPTATMRSFGAREDALLEAGDVGGAVELNVDTWVGSDATDDVRDLVRRMQRRAFDVQLAAEEGEGPEPEETEIAVDPARIRCPTLVVSGDLDLDFFQNIAAHLASHIPGAEAVTLPCAAHLPSLERPDAVTALLADFLDRTLPTT